MLARPTRFFHCASPVADAMDRHGGVASRYAPYPATDRFVEAFDSEAYGHWLANRRIGGITRSLGLYVHIPLCDALCFYCACTRIATRDHAKARKYAGYLAREIELAAAHLGGDRRISRMYWGGGTPTFFGDEESTRLMNDIRSCFDLDPEGEYGIELDPRGVGAGRIATLARLGFNRIRVGVRDFAPDVQRHVDRLQSCAETRAVIDAARAHGFHSVDLELSYGLPKQTAGAFGSTLEQVVECDPDRIALNSLARWPAKHELLLVAIRQLGEAGYEHVGVDQFAKPRRGPARGAGDLIGLGVSAIGRIGPAYCQNARTLDEYCGRLDCGELPVWRGIELRPDDLVRRAVIQALGREFMVSREAIGVAHLVDFDRYFAAELRELASLAEDGLVQLEGEWIEVTLAGRPVVPVVCAAFDRYRRAARERTRCTPTL